ncbi:hypothetical protein BDV12DRAFT_202694 [Aspergillus spectabilis]
MTTTVLLASSLYRLGNILVGKPIVIPTTPSPAAAITPTEWTLQPGVYTPRQIVQGFAPLLDTVLHHLTPEPSARPPRAQLLDNIAAILSTDSRESSLPFPPHVPDNSRREIRDQARRIGQHLVKWAHDAPDGIISPDLNIRSRCEGHLLIPENVDLLFGRRSKPQLMQLFNEYMHQMVLLRDSLLPFHNYEDVLIPVSGRGRGLRHMEGTREKFMAALFTKQVTQASVVEIAKALLAPGLPRTATGGYGFQYANGTVIPALFIAGERSFHLLQYLPARVAQSNLDILFDYEFTDYYAAPRVEISKGETIRSLTTFPKKSPPRVETTSFNFVPSHTSGGSVGRLNLHLEFNNGQSATVDVGQIARGHRYSYEAGQAGEVDVLGIIHAAHTILLQSGAGLVTAQEGGFHVITAEEQIVALAVLGKLYPENVVNLSRKDRLEKAVNSGKGFEPKFVVWG